MDQLEVRLYRTNGTLIDVFDNWASLSVERRINDFSTHTFSFNLRDPRVADFVKDSIIEVRRKNEYLDWHQEYVGFHRSPRKQMTADGKEIFTCYGRSLEDLLRRRILAFQEPYTKTGPADDVMKALVRENTTAFPGRYRDGTISSLVVEPDTSEGPVWEGERHHQNLLDVVREISEVSGVDFDITWVAGQFVFDTYWPQRGIDRTNLLVFSADLGNLRSVDYTKSATEEVNSVIVFTGPTPFLKETSAATESPWNRAETIVDISADTTPDFLADVELARGAAQENISVEIIQVPSCNYGTHYFLGDLVTVRIGESYYDKKIMGVRLTESGDTHNLVFSFADLEPLTDPLIAGFRNIVRRVKRLETI